MHTWGVLKEQGYIMKYTQMKINLYNNDMKYLLRARNTDKSSLNLPVFTF